MQEDLRKVRSKISAEDQRMLDEHATFVREMEKELTNAENQKLLVPAPKLEDGVSNRNDSMPKLAKMQIDMLVNSMINDMTRVGTLQIHQFRWQCPHELGSTSRKAITSCLMILI